MAVQVLIQGYQHYEKTKKIAQGILELFYHIYYTEFTAMLTSLSYVLNILVSTITKSEVVLDKIKLDKIKLGSTHRNWPLNA